MTSLTAGDVTPSADEPAVHQSVRGGRAGAEGRPEPALLGHDVRVSAPQRQLAKGVQRGPHGAQQEWTESEYRQLYTQ